MQLAEAASKNDPLASSKGANRLLAHLPKFAIASLALTATWFGWRTFWFLTDDAFITFRYVSNAVLGRGFVWNPAPFLPVEGYTSFLWTALLTIVWKLTGLTPPLVCNWLSLGFGIATLGVITRIAFEMPLPERAQSLRTTLWALVLLGTVSNRTFLTWLSSGLETSLHNMLLAVWIWSALRDTRRPIWLASSASLLALARPDGLLFVAATPVLLAARTWTTRKRFPLLALAPLLVVFVHLAWRLHTYGEWVPNTYYAKHVASWPEAGVRYAALFIIEYGLWFWTLIILAWTIACVRSGQRVSLDALRAQAPRLVMLATLVAHVAYYTFVIGGDHFEFRVYSHLIPFFFLTATWCAAWTFKKRSEVVISCAFFILVSWPIPWAHFQHSKGLMGRASTSLLAVSVAEHVALPMRPLALAWDELQEWLVKRMICTRHQEHKQFWLHRMRLVPTRERGETISWSERPVMTAESVGIFAWVLPNVAIIDKFGLNDRVAAHTPADHTKLRRMAHERMAPDEYLRCFRPNFFWTGQRVRFAHRTTPLRDSDIVACEARFAPVKR
jgi:arabinofuranosyltransferase